jgi:hypothetical protein
LTVVSKQAAGRWQQAVSNPDVFSFRAFTACCLLLSDYFLKATRIVSWKRSNRGLVAERLLSDLRVSVVLTLFVLRCSKCTPIHMAGIIRG